MLLDECNQVYNLSRSDLVRYVFERSELEYDSESLPYRMQIHLLAKGIILSDNSELLSFNDLKRMACAHGARDVYGANEEERKAYIKIILESQVVVLQELFDKDDLNYENPYFYLLRNNLYSLGRTPLLSREQKHWYFNHLKTGDVISEFRNI
jgi:hypothetical protein